MNSKGNNQNNNFIFNEDEAMNALKPKSKNDGFRALNLLSGNIIQQNPLGAPLQFNTMPPLESLQKSHSFPSGQINFDYFNKNMNNDNNRMMDLDVEPFPIQTKSKSCVNSTIQLINPPLNFPNENSQNFHDDMIVFVESKIPKFSNHDNAPLSPPMIYNKYSSCTIRKYSATTVLQKLCELLDDYSNEIDFNVDQNSYTIEGIVFIRHYAIYWAITVWEQSANSVVNSIVEFQKRRGDCAGFQNFWNDMLKKIDEQFGVENVDDAQRCYNFESLFVSVFDFCEPMKFDEEQLNNLQEQLDDDYYEIATEALRLLCSRLESDATFSGFVLKHEGLMKTLTKTVLNHIDPTHVRGALKALQLIINAAENCINQLIGRYQVLNSVIRLLQHQQALIRKHAVRLLALLSQKEWNLPNNQYSQIQSQLKKLQNEWNIYKPNNHKLYNNPNNDHYNDENNKEFISWKMFDKIEKRIHLSSSFSFSFTN